ncbi:RNA-guided endonuclease InsQ/TnpB family protein [Deinococcus ruber]|uniref:Transposase n=1 Tax=Deinococcus ruber TaxID=1848197 RepID=A0A918CL40_9DEIO|nr:RNA-guided endonuclease TnpB family protein [Deinococcus ruber]GGR30891.1 transposase [Deinococcus ruber]
MKLNATQAQCLFFGRAAGASRFTWNWALAQCTDIRHATGKNPTMGDLKKRFNAIKETEFPWIYDSPKDANQQPFTFLQRAWTRFWDGVKDGKIPVWNTAQKKALLAEGKKRSELSFAPTFKKKKDGASFYVSNDKFSIDRESRTVTLPKVGQVKLAELPRFRGKVMSGTVSKDGNDWYLSVQIDVADRDYFRFRSGDGVIGIDLGVKDTAVLSTGEKLTGPKPFKRACRRLAILQRRVSRKQAVVLDSLGLNGKAIPKGTRLTKSNNQKRSERLVHAVQSRVKHIRQNFQHTFTTRIIRENQAVVIEDLNVAGMMANHKLARSIADIGMGEIRRQLTYKAARYGTALHLADRWYPSSKTCSDCGWKKADLTLNDRTWVCEDCGVIHDRDVNAALNLKNLVPKVLAPQDEVVLPGGYRERHALPVEVLFQPSEFMSALGEASGQEKKGNDSLSESVVHQTTLLG